MRKNSVRYGMLAWTLLLFFAGGAWGVIREGAIPGHPGLSFHDVHYRFRDLTLRINNGTGRNVSFAATMVFMDRHHRPVARVELLPQKIRRNGFQTYRGFFTLGSGEEAAAASEVTWEAVRRHDD